MAKSTYLLLLGLSLAAGCQSTTNTANLPEPNFSAPVVTRPAPMPIASLPPVKPVQSAPQIKQAAPAPVAGNREWAPSAPARPWRYIVIHHSDTSGGSAGRFDQFHKQKGWDELGYHFVIGNGTESRDGQVEIGPRWPKQKWGAHTKTPDNRYNDYGIGICLVGNFQDSRPTAEQMKSLSKLVAHLMKTYKVRPEAIIGHGDAKPTDCPGRNMSIATVRRQATQLLADSNWTPDASTIAAGEELLQAVQH